MDECVYIGLGSNLGDRQQHLLDAVEALSAQDGLKVLRRSSFWDTEAIGPLQPRYVNAVVEVASQLEPHALLETLKRLEKAQGRVPQERWGPRAIDLDILFWPGRVVKDAHLQIPHKELLHRRFALAPLCELAPMLIHPEKDLSLATLLQKLPLQDVVCLSSVL